jgi:hypothetical protein
MNEINCENALMAKMAEFDGEDAGFSAEQINSHFAVCENCRTEFGQMQNINYLFENQTRRGQEADLWFDIENRIGAQTASPISLKPFILLGLILLIYKLLELLPAQDFGLAFKIVPLIFVIALFVFIKENPFKINAELALEK